MIDQKQITDGTLIEEKFCKVFDNLQKHPMTQELSKAMISLLFADPTKPIPKLTAEFLFRLITKRVEICFTFKITDWRLTTFLMFLSETPGNAVMYLTYLQYWCKKHNVKELDINIFCESIFPWGFPSKDDMLKLWDDTKVYNREGSSDSDNLVDYASAMKSIQF